MKSRNSLLIDLLIEKVDRLTCDIENMQAVIDEMNQNESDRMAKLKKGQVRDVGFYRVKTIKGWSTAEWTGEMWKFSHPSNRGGVIEVADA